MISAFDGGVLGPAVLGLQHQAVFLAQPSHQRSPSDVSRCDHTQRKRDVAERWHDVLFTAA